MATYYAMIRSARLCLLLFLALPAMVQAQYNYTTNNGTITITQYTGPGGAVIVPDFIDGLKVTGIGTAAFYQVSGMTSVTMGSNLTTIADNAYFQCYNLASATIAGSVTNIGLGPFVDCQSLTGISLSSPSEFYSVTNGVLFDKAQTSLIQMPGGFNGSFTLAAAVTNVGLALIGNTLTSISVDPANLFFASLNGVLFDKSLTYLYSYPGGAPGAYTVPKAVTTIVSAAFEYSPGITSVTIGTNVTSIGLFALFDCPNLTAITVDTNSALYSSVNGILFDRNKTLLIQYPSALPGSYVIPDTVVTIGDGAFADNPGLTSVVIPNSVTDIGQQAFYSCQNMTNLTLGSGVKSIGQLAFFLGQGLRHVVFPASLASLGFESFAGCQKLTNACFEGNEPVDEGSVFLFDNALSTILHVNGTTGWGAAYDGIVTAPCATCGGTAPQLAIALSGAEVILTWADSFSGFTLQSTPNITPSPAWSTVNPPPADLNGLNTVTNSTSGKGKFYRLVGP